MFWPLGVYFIAVIAIVGGLFVVSWLLGERHRERATGEPYESGIPPTESARLRISVKFYQLAMFFVIFDVAAGFVFAWAIALRDAGWRGYAGLLAFLSVLASALLYLAREGALDWGRRTKQ